MGHYRDMVLVVVVVFISLPLMGINSPSTVSIRAYTPVQHQIIQFVGESGAQFVAFKDEYRFFAPGFGCRSEGETAYVVTIINQGRQGDIGFCVGDGEGGEIRFVSLD
jgi:hypothetical protein